MSVVMKVTVGCARRNHERRKMEGRGLGLAVDGGAGVFDCPVITQPGPFRRGAGGVHVRRLVRDLWDCLSLRHVAATTADAHVLVAGVAGFFSAAAIFVDQPDGAGPAFWQGIRRQPFHLETR